MAAALLVAGSALLVARGSRGEDETVSYKSGDETVSAYLGCQRSGQAPGDHRDSEYWGLNDWVKDQAQNMPRRLCGAGRGFVPRQVAATPDEAHILMRGLPMIAGCAIWRRRSRTCLTSM